MVKLWNTPIVGLGLIGAFIHGDFDQPFFGSPLPGKFKVGFVLISIAHETSIDGTDLKSVMKMTSYYAQQPIPHLIILCQIS